MPTDKKDETENKDVNKVQHFNPKTLTDEEFAKVFSDERLWKNERFKELNDKAKKADELTKLQEEADEKKLIEEKKLQEVIEIQKAKIKSLEDSVTQVRIDSEIRNEATKLGVVDPDVVTKLIDKGKIELGADGAVKGVTEAVKSLTEEKPYLVGKPVTPNLGAGTNPAGGNASPQFKLSQLQDASFYQANEKEITEALKNNLIENDMPTGIK